MDTVRRPLKEAFLASKIVILDYFSRELPWNGHIPSLKSIMDDYMGRVLMFCICRISNVSSSFILEI